MNQYCDYFCTNKDPWTGYCRSTACTKQNQSTVTYLPTAKEYREAANTIAFQFTRQWSDPKYQCPECGGGMCRNEMIVLTTYPAKYEYQCDKCGYTEYQYM